MMGCLPGALVWPQVEPYFMRHHRTDIKICDTFIWRQRQLSCDPETDEEDDIDPNCTQDWQYTLSPLLQKTVLHLAFLGSSLFEIKQLLVEEK
jgi:hypothetical protein